MSSDRPKAFLDWLDQRSGYRALVQSQLTGYQLDAANQSWFTLGGLLIFMLLLQIASGILLLFYYSPDPEFAFESVRALRREIPFGWLIQLIHGHGANLMVLAVFIHMLRGAYLGAYKSPRELNWLTGCGLLALTLGASLTGYILPWSQVSYWATTVVTSAMDSIPLVGHEMMRAVRGGEMVGPPTFRRAFAAHVALIPLLMLGLVGIHLYLLRLRGSAPPLQRKGARAKKARPLAFYPSFVLQDGIIVLGYLLILFGLIFFAPNLFHAPQSFMPADPLDTPPNVKPEWYFLWGYALLRLFPEWLGLLLQGVGFGLLVALPFLDRSPYRHPLDRPFVSLAIVAGAIVFVALTLYGYWV